MTNRINPLMEALQAPILCGSRYCGLRVAKRPGQLADGHDAMLALCHLGKRLM